MNIENKLENVYSKNVKMQATGKDGKTTRISMPREVVNREARNLGLSFEEFIEKYEVMWLYDGFTGAYAKFVPVEKK